MTGATFSIVLCSYNRPGLLQRAIDSAIAVEAAKTIIIVDDASSDTAVHKIIDHAVKTDKRVLPHFRLVNGGESAALNSGIKLLSADWVVPLHDDDELDPVGVPLLVDYAAENRLEVAWGDAMDIDIHSVPQKLVRGARPDKQRVWKEDYFYFPAMIWRKEIHKKIGWFDEALVSNVDWDFKIRVINECRCGYAPVTVVNYRRHPLNKSTINAGAVMQECEQTFRNRLKGRYGY